MLPNCLLMYSMALFPQNPILSLCAFIPPILQLSNVHQVDDAEKVEIS